MSKNKTRFLTIVAAVFVAFSVIACGKAGNFKDDHENPLTLGMKLPCARQSRRAASTRQD